MPHDLPRLGTTDPEAHTICNGIEAAFEQLQQVLTRLALAPVGFRVTFTELTLEDAVKTTNFLFSRS